MSTEYRFTFPQENVDTTGSKVRISKGGTYYYLPYSTTSIDYNFTVDFPNKIAVNNNNLYRFAKRTFQLSYTPSYFSNVRIDVAIKFNGRKVCGISNATNGSAVTFYGLGDATIEITFTNKLSSEQIIEDYNGIIHALPYTSTFSFTGDRDYHWNYSLDSSYTIFSRISDFKVNGQQALQANVYDPQSLGCSIEKYDNLAYYVGASYTKSPSFKLTRNSNYQILKQYISAKNVYYPYPKLKVVPGTWAQDRFLNLIGRYYLSTASSFEGTQMGDPNISSDHKSYNPTLTYTLDDIRDVGATQGLDIWINHYGILFNELPFDVYYRGVKYSKGYNYYFKSGEYFFGIADYGSVTYWYQWHKLTLTIDEIAPGVTSSIIGSSATYSSISAVTVDTISVKVPDGDGVYIRYTGKYESKSLFARVTVKDGGNEDWNNNTIACVNIPQYVIFKWHIGRVKNNASTSNKNNTWTDMTLTPDAENSKTATFQVKDGHSFDWSDTYVCCYISEMRVTQETITTSKYHWVNAGTTSDIATN